MDAQRNYIPECCRHGETEERRRQREKKKSQHKSAVMSNVYNNTYTDYRLRHAHRTSHTEQLCTQRNRCTYVRWAAFTLLCECVHWRTAATPSFDVLRNTVYSQWKTKWPHSCATTTHNLFLMKSERDTQKTKHTQMQNTHSLGEYIACFACARWFALTLLQMHLHSEIRIHKYIRVEWIF